MDLINSNPYRKLGLLVGTKASEQSRQIKRLKQFIEAEQEPDADFSFPILGNFSRTLESVADAEQKINLDNDKMNAALFWFYNGNTITDEPAFDFLTHGNIDEAKSIWTKLTTSSNINERNSSAFQNLSTLLLYNAFSINNSQLEKGISLKLQFLESEFVNDFVKIVTDETYKTTNLELQILFLNQLQSEIEKSKIFSTVDFLKVLNNLSFSAKEDFFKIFVQKPIEEIEKIITETKAKRKSDKTKSIEFGNNLYNSTQEDLEQLKSIIGKTNVKFISISDKVADEILQCGIENFNSYKDSDENKAKETLDLFQKVEKLAFGNITIGRYLENYTAVQDWVDYSKERNELTKCWYCLKNNGEATYTYNTKMYKETSRSPFYERNRKVTYEVNSIKINRCKKCNNIHEKGSKTASKVGISLFVVIFICSILYFFSTSEIFWSIVGSLMLSTFSALIVYAIISSITNFVNAKKYKIKKLSNIDDHPVIKELYKKGWSSTPPSA